VEQAAAAVVAATSGVGVNVGGGVAVAALVGRGAAQVGQIGRKDGVAGQVTVPGHDPSPRLTYPIEYKARTHREAKRIPIPAPSSTAIS
jgi:hypothetical protein